MDTSSVGIRGGATPCDELLIVAARSRNTRAAKLLTEAEKLVLIGVVGWAVRTFFIKTARSASIVTARCVARIALTPVVPDYT